MAKGLRSKIKRKWRAVKRKTVGEQRINDVLMGTRNRLARSLGVPVEALPNMDEALLKTQYGMNTSYNPHVFARPVDRVRFVHKHPDLVDEEVEAAAAEGRAPLARPEAVAPSEQTKYTKERRKLSLEAKQRAKEQIGGDQTGKKKGKKAAAAPADELEMEEEEER